MAGAGETSQRNLELYIRATGNLRRALRSLGLQRQPHEPKPQAAPGGPLGRLLVADYERQQIADREKRRAEFEEKHAQS